MILALHDFLMRVITLIRTILGTFANRYSSCHDTFDMVEQQNVHVHRTKLCIGLLAALPYNEKST